MITVVTILKLSMYEGDKAVCFLLSPNFNQTSICQQILITPLILKFANIYY